jgi:hypothetical protein
MTKSILRFALVSVSALAIGSPALADHAWGSYHWSKGSGPLTIPVGDNVDSKWQVYLERAMAGGPRVTGGTGEGWNATAEIESPIVAGGTTPKRCRAAAGRIEVCNATYGRNGWLGIAGISISGGHITSGYTKLNDSYFNMAQYNKPEWRMMVTCQEIGHDYGLGHTDETFNNYNHGTCMDYTNQPAGGLYNGFNYGPNNEYIFQHDKDQLASIYAHSHQSTTDFGERTVGGGRPAAPPALEVGDSPADWGRAVGYDGQGRPNRFEKSEPGRKIIIHVFWAIGEGPRGRQHDHH